MSASPTRRARTIRAVATLVPSACLLLLATGPLAHAVQIPGQTAKTCAHINGCSASASSPPTASLGGPPARASHLNVAVATAPKSATAARRASGTLMTKPSGALAIRCGGYRLKSPNTFKFQLQATAATSSTGTSSPGGVFKLKLFIVYELTERITNTTAAGVNFCLGADFRFKTLSGRPAPARRLPDGTQGHVGLLPPCPQPLPPPGQTTMPCLEPVTTVPDPNSASGVDVILNARIPVEVAAATIRGSGDSVGGDPWGGG